jgi:hypothetical protein
MQRLVTYAPVCALAGLLMISQAHAQGTAPPPTPVCGNPDFTTPLEALVGTWTFSSKTFAAARFSHQGEAEGGNQGAQPFVSAGTFEASIRAGTAATVGVLTITQSSNNNGKVTRQETLIGTYDVFPDCSGGTLTFNMSSQPIHFDFWFAGVRNQIAAVSTTPAAVIWTDGTRLDSACHDRCFACDGNCNPGGDGTCANQFIVCINSCTATGRPSRRCLDTF